MQSHSYVKSGLMEYNTYPLMAECQVSPYRKVASEDITKQAEKEIHEMYEKFMDELASVLTSKEKEILNS